MLTMRRRLASFARYVWVCLFEGLCMALPILRRCLFPLLPHCCCCCYPIVTRLLPLNPSRCYPTAVLLLPHCYPRQKWTTRLRVALQLELYLLSLKDTSRIVRAWINQSMQGAGARLSINDNFSGTIVDQRTKSARETPDQPK